MRQLGILEAKIIKKAKRAKRKIVVNSKAFYWWVYDFHNQTAFDGVQLHMEAEIQSLYLSYGLEQGESERFVIVSTPNASIALRCPKFENNSGIITQTGIRELILWCSQSGDKNNEREITGAYLCEQGEWNWKSDKTTVLYEIVEALNRVF